VLTVENCKILIFWQHIGKMKHERWNLISQAGKCSTGCGREPINYDFLRPKIGILGILLRKAQELCFG
jgi:hypothetical protein